jgi:hypothetical protein
MYPILEPEVERKRELCKSILNRDGNNKTNQIKIKGRYIYIGAQLTSLTSILKQNMGMSTIL